MCNEKGSWIKIYRKCESNPLYFSEPFTKWQAWEDLLLKANYKDSHYFSGGQQIDVNRGQVGISMLTMSKRWKWSRKKVANFLNYLEKEHQIVQQRNNRTTLISILNYNIYQSENDEKEHQKNIRRTSEEHIQEVKEVKEVKEIEKEIHAENSLSLKNLVFEFKNDKDEQKKAIDPFENPEQHNSSGTALNAFNDIFKNKWPKAKRGNYKEALNAYFKHYDVSKGVDDIYIAIEEYQKTQNYRDGVIMKMSTFFQEWDNFLPEEKENTEHKKQCDICNSDGYVHINSQNKEGNYNSNTDSYYYTVKCKCISSKNDFESLIGVSEDQYMSLGSNLTEEYKENIKRRLVSCN